MANTFGNINTGALLNPVFHGAKTSTQNIGGAAGTTVYITWGSEIVKDTGFTHSTVTNPSRITVDDAGRYRITATIASTNVSAGANRFSPFLQFRIDGTTMVTRGRGSTYSRGTAFNAVSNVHLDTEYDLTAGQYIEIATVVNYTDATYTVNTVNANCEVIVRRLR